MTHQEEMDTIQRIMEDVMGWRKADRTGPGDKIYLEEYAEVAGHWYAHFGYDDGPKTFNPLRYDEATCIVLDKMSERGFHARYQTPFQPGGLHHCGFTPHGVTGWNGRPDYRGSGETRGEAVCEAALEAVRALEHDSTAPPAETTAHDH